MSEFSDALGPPPLVDEGASPGRKQKKEKKHKKDRKAGASSPSFNDAEKSGPVEQEPAPAAASQSIADSFTFGTADPGRTADLPPALGVMNSGNQSPRSSRRGSSPSPAAFARSARKRNSLSHLNGLSEMATYWYDVLTRYGGMEGEEATKNCLLFEKANLPFPSPDADAYLTHEFLESIGITNPGDRCRVLLACKRMPELRHKQRAMEGSVLFEPEEDITKEDEGKKPLIEASMFGEGMEGEDKTSYEQDTSVVKLSRFQPSDGAFEWIDLIGKDVPDLDTLEGDVAAAASTPPTPGSLANEKGGHGRKSIGMDIMRKASTSATPPPGHLVQMTSPQPQAKGRLDGSKWADAMHQVFEATGEHDPNECLISKKADSTTVDQRAQGVAEEEEEKSTLLVDLLSTKLPLPQLRIDRTRPSKCCFVLRVCTLDVEDEDDTMRSLTNRWTIFVDAANKTVVTVHRVDSVALATLRDNWQDGQIPAGISFNEFIVKLLERFLLEYEKALGASDEWLDSCEASMLRSTSGSNDDLLTNLFHLQRRASVYDRMVILSRNLLQREVSKHLMLGDDLESLESRFQQLQEKTVELGSRAQNLLEIHLSLTGYHTNELMKLLTKVSMFFTPITFLAGLWGMNFENMPELKWDYGYYCALALMVCIGCAMLGWFRYAKI